MKQLIKINNIYATSNKQQATSNKQQATSNFDYITENSLLIQHIP